MFFKLHDLQPRIFSYNCFPSTSELHTASQLSHVDFSFYNQDLFIRPWTSNRKPNLDRKS